MIDVTGEPVSRAEFEKLKAVVNQHHGALSLSIPPRNPGVKDLDIVICLGAIILVTAYFAYRYPEAFQE